MGPDGHKVLKVSQANYTVKEQMGVCKVTLVISHCLKILWIIIKDCGSFSITINVFVQVYFLQDTPLHSKQ